MAPDKPITDNEIDDRLKAALDFLGDEPDETVAETRHNHQMYGPTSKTDELNEEITLNRG